MPYLNRYLIGIVDPYQIPEPSENTYGFSESGFATILANSRSNILTFRTGIEKTILGYLLANLFDNSPHISDGRLFITSNLGTVGRFYQRLTIAANLPSQAMKLNIELPTDSFISIDFENNDATSHRLGIIVTGWKIRRISI